MAAPKANRVFPSARQLTRLVCMRVLIADDQEFIRRGVRAALSEETDIDVCAEAIDGRDALKKAFELRPDIVIMDIVMPRMDGIEATRLLRKALPEIKILSLSQYDIPEIAKEAEQAGAAAFVSKLLVWDKLVPSLRRVHLGETFFS
jgi:two-component system, NarL family, response regulator LiaR